MRCVDDVETYPNVNKLLTSPWKDHGQESSCIIVMRAMIKERQWSMSDKTVESGGEPDQEVSEELPHFVKEGGIEPTYNQVVGG